MCRQHVSLLQEQGNATVAELLGLQRQHDRRQQWLRDASTRANDHQRTNDHAAVDDYDPSVDVRACECGRVCQVVDGRRPRRWYLGVDRRDVRQRRRGLCGVDDVSLL